MADLKKLPLLHFGAQEVVSKFHLMFKLKNGKCVVRNRSKKPKVKCYEID